MGRVLCTHDTDFYQLASEGIRHAGLVIGHPELHTIGDWVNGLALIHAVYSAEDMRDRIEFL